ncbi:MAG: hypothetical protein K6U74_15575 [Firmicutes bacterium]|nr:hypothetical protein [Bacillota bacterium]
MAEPIFQLTVLYVLFLGLLWSIKKVIRAVAKVNISTIIIVLLALSPLLAYIPVEINTIIYGKQFKFIEEQPTNIPIIYYKVFSINKEEAKLFIVRGKNNKHEIGSFYWFKKVNDKWLPSHSKTVWTNLGGSASEFTFPPYF